MEEFSPDKKWHLKKLFLSQAAIILLLFTWFCHLTHPFWELADLNFLKFVNSFIKTSPLWQNFWAISSHNYMDWFHDVIMIIFFVYYVKKKDEKPKLYKFCEILFFGLLIATTIVIINRYVFTEIFHIARKSPSLIYDFTVHLSDKVSWIKVKDRSYTSFPGDHSTTALLFSMCMFHLFGKKEGMAAFLYTIYWQMPRLVTGSHWLTDVVMGSLPIATAVISAVVYSPIKNSVSMAIYKGLCKLIPNKTKPEPENS